VDLEFVLFKIRQKTRNFPSQMKKSRYTGGQIVKALKEKENGRRQRVNLSDYSTIDQLRKIHPETSFIFIYHTTKEGNFRGVNEHAHEVDVIIQVKKCETCAKGRFSAGGQIKL
jgi:hypothetical protein